MAENWSRRDQIRAGVVSGPWRSVPRSARVEPASEPEPAETPEVAAREPAPVRATETAGARPQPAMPRVENTKPLRSATPGRSHVSVGRATRPSPPGRLAMVGWIGFGLLFAGSCIGLAFLFQPAAMPPEPGPEVIDASSPAEADGIAASAPVAQVSVAVPALPPEMRQALTGIESVRLRTGPKFAEADRDRLAAALGDAGVPGVQIEALPFKVATSRVGYYLPEDRAAAEALAALVGPMLSYGGPLAVRDYGALLDSPQAGRLDLWVGG